MKKLLFYLQLILVGFMVSCEKNDLSLVVNQEDNASESSMNMKISVPEAIIIADDFFSKMEDNQTRSARTISSIQAITNGEGKNVRSVNDTLFYLFNYTEGGFAVIGANKKMAPILAISVDGSFNLEDTVNNPGLALYVENLRSIEANIPSILSDSPFIPSQPDPIDPIFPAFKTKIHKDIKPLLKHHPKNWYQRTPFNVYCPININKGQRAYVGCVPLACAQIMSYFEWPTTYSGINLNWSNINSILYPATITCPDWLAKFLHEVGLTLKVEYNINGSLESGTSKNNIKKYFSQFGYEKLSDPKNLTHNSASVDLESSPLLVLGSNVESNSGHCWVIDGYLSYSIYGGTSSSFGDLISSYSLYHCVWGWGGLDNGYFLWRDGSEVSTLPYKYEDNDLKKSTNISKYRDLMYFSNFKIKK
ncbi:MAG: C10 family peptidase [Muribaculaceae bacterium]|nr:C10 family peptidase [Muribaculaceae bacterium]